MRRPQSCTGAEGDDGARGQARAEEEGCIKDGCRYPRTSPCGHPQVGSRYLRASRTRRVRNWCMGVFRKGRGRIWLRIAGAHLSDAGLDGERIRMLHAAAAGRVASHMRKIRRSIGSAPLCLIRPKRCSLLRCQVIELDGCLHQAAISNHVADNPEVSEFSELE